MGSIIRIDDPDDPRLSPYRALRDRDLVSRTGRDGHEGRFVAEGEVVLRALLSRRSRFAAASLLVADDRADSLEGLLNAAPDGLPVFVAPRVLVQGIVGFPIHRGLLGIGFRGPVAAPADVLPRSGPSLVLCLVGLANHDNVGAAFRNAAAFAADAVLLDSGTCDPLYRKALRVSVGASLLVPFARAGPPAALLATLLRAGYVPVALSPSGRRTLTDHVWPDRTALIVGSEGEGLPAAILQAAASVRIAMPGRIDSLNVGTATGIALHAVRSHATVGD